MTDDPSLERAARSWIETGPTQAPDQAVDTALQRIQSTRQERDLIPWRLPTMNPILRVAGVTLVAAIALALGIYALRPTSNVGQGVPTPTDQSVATPAPGLPSAAVTAPIPNGTYRTSIPVADVLARLDADGSLTPAEKTAVIDDVLGIRGASVLNVEITVADNSFTVGLSTDSEPIKPGSSWKLYNLDASTIAVDIGTKSSGIQAYRVTRTGLTFALAAVSPAEAVETFVRSVLFETAPFSPAT
jgi:hypothetical protein